jgi:hypothetical protein
MIPPAGRALARKAGRQMRNSMETIGWLIYRINHPLLRSMFMVPSDRFRMRAGLVTMLAGNLQRGWRYSAPFLAFKSVFYALSLAYRFGLPLHARLAPDPVAE